MDCVCTDQHLLGTFSKWTQMLVHSFEATILGPLILFNSSWNTFVIPSVYLQEKYKPHVQTRPDQTCHTKVVTKNDNEYKEGPS